MARHAVTAADAFSFDTAFAAQYPDFAPDASALVFEELADAMCAAAPAHCSAQVYANSAAD